MIVIDAVVYALNTKNTGDAKMQAAALTINAELSRLRALCRQLHDSLEMIVPATGPGRDLYAEWVRAYRGLDDGEQR